MYSLWQHVFDLPSLVAIEASTITKLWAGGSEHVARLVAATAINKAIKLRLKHAVAEEQHQAAC